MHAPPATAIAALPMPWPPALHGAVLRAAAADFMVTERLSFTPSGAGEHALVRLRKTGLDTGEVARRLAAFAGVKARAVGFAGRKDRHAVTEQWFSVQLPGQPDPDWTALNGPQIEVLDVTRNARKLRIGALAGNAFGVVLREAQADRAALDALLRHIAAHGVPNYFGPQRFGNAGANLDRAHALMAGRIPPGHEDRSMALSAARSAIFNAVLARRVEQGTWNQALPGEVLMLDGCHSIFAADPDDAAVPERVAAGAVHPTGPLWGTGTSRVSGACAVLEADVAAGLGDLATGLERLGVARARRALRVPVREFTWAWQGDALELGFALPPGSFATTVVAALGATRQPTASLTPAGVDVMK